MDFLHRIVEDKIRAAQEEGVFEDLPDKGKPFHFEDATAVPEDLRLAHKILKNADCLPPELELRKEIFSLRQLLNAAVDPETRREVRRELNYLILKANLGRQAPIVLDIPQVRK